MHNNKVQFFFLFIVTMKSEHKHTHAQQTNVYENSIYMKINKMAAVWEAQGGQHCPCVCGITTTNSIKTFALAPN